MSAHTHTCTRTQFACHLTFKSDHPQSETGIYKVGQFRLLWELETQSLLLYYYLFLYIFSIQTAVNLLLPTPVLRGQMKQNPDGVGY